MIPPTNLATSIATASVAYVNWVVIPVEEGKLTEVFGDEYLGYQARTRRWL
jgi:protein-S-isoprenylcysteine O-methyltransferase Ste14